MLTFLAAPLATLVLRSLRVGDGWGLGHYRDLATTGAGGALLVPASTALANSWRVAVDATLLALLLGGLVAAVVSRRPRAARPAARRSRCSTPSSCCRSASPR